MTVNEMIVMKKEYGLSYDYIAEKSGVPVSTVQKVFSKTTLTPRRETIEGLQKAFTEYGENITNGIVCENEADYNSGTSAFAIDSFGTKTVEDYLNLPEGARMELIDGEFYDMAAPTTVHQSIAFEIGTELKQFIKSNKGSCVTFAAPTDVQLDRDDKTMVQPDVFVVCDRNKITKERVVGAPDLVIEVLSESHWYNDMVVKFRKYREAGVREYWIVIPANKRVLVYSFEKRSRDREPAEYTFGDKIPVGIWEGKCEVDFREIYNSISFLLS
ncbi:MAG: Uma2 family endonuclease [Lachnospiraceae bacterium]|nr:Uma2 family endonuclease [Lachnospiraceae bacterium]